MTLAIGNLGMQHWEESMSHRSIGQSKGIGLSLESLAMGYDCDLGTGHSSTKLPLHLQQEIRLIKWPFLVP